MSGGWWRWQKAARCCVDRGIGSTDCAHVDFEWVLHYLFHRTVNTIHRPAARRLPAATPRSVEPRWLATPSPVFFLPQPWIDIYIYFVVVVTVDSITRKGGFLRRQRAFLRPFFFVVDACPVLTHHGLSIMNERTTFFSLSLSSPLTKKGRLF